MRARKAEVALYAEAIGKPYRGDLRQAEASKLGTAETKVGEAEQGVAVIGKLGREPCRRTHRVEQLDHRHRVRRGLPVAVGCAPRDVICAQGVAEFGGKENHAAILPLACASCASCCRASNQSAALQIGRASCRERGCLCVWMSG